MKDALLNHSNGFAKPAHPETASTNMPTSSKPTSTAPAAPHPIPIDPSLDVAIMEPANHPASVSIPRHFFSFLQDTSVNFNFFFPIMIPGNRHNSSFHRRQSAWCCSEVCCGHPRSILRTSRDSQWVGRLRTPDSSKSSGFRVAEDLFGTRRWAFILYFSLDADCYRPC